MAYLKTRQVAAVALCAALWGVLNSVFSPIVFSLTGLPVLCDLIGFTVLTLAAWWIRKPGALTAIGVIATVINFAINPQAVIFLGFTAASAVFDAATGLASQGSFYARPRNVFALAIFASAISASVAGTLIGLFFMVGPAMAVWGGVAGWAALHAAGGLVGGALGGLLVNMLVSRKVAASA